MHSFFGKEISGPFTIPSGIVTTDVTVIERIANTVPEIGILTTKSIGLQPKTGNREPIIARYAPRTIINAVGLSNPGAIHFAQKLATIKIPKNKFLLISIFGGDENEFAQVAKILYKYADGFELNLSCPHSKRYGQVVGANYELAYKITRAVSALGKPTLVKISPSFQIETMIQGLLDAGANGFVAINTKGPQSFTHDNHPVLSNKVGSLSGRIIFNIGLDCVKRIRRLTDLPIIANAGISTASDIKKYKSAGANYFGIGTALTGLTTDEIRRYFYHLAFDLASNTNETSLILKKNIPMHYMKFRIKNKIQLATDMFVLEFNQGISIKPGQYVFVWIPEKGEKPFSVFDDRPMSLLIQNRGFFTIELSKLEAGDTVYIRGPYGNSPKVSKNTLLVGGGSGVAGLYLFAKRKKGMTAILGAKDKKHLYFEKFEKVCKKIYLTTDKGDFGKKGFITQYLDEILKESKPDYCLNCGPEPMVHAAIEKEKKALPQERIFSSIEYLTKCGIGLCGSCATSKGYRNCIDGTFLTPMQI